MRPVLASIRRIAAAAVLIVPAATSYALPSLAAEPTMADCLSASEASIKLRKEHHLREARQQLLVCAALQCPDEVRSECERHLVAVNSTIPTLVFEAKDLAGNDLSAVTVTMDGKPLADRLEGTALPLDPGTHSFHFEAAGHAPVDKSFVLHEGEKERRERIVFVATSGTASPPAPAPTEAAKGQAQEVAPPAAPAHGSSSKWGPLKTAGIVIGGVGIVGIGVGAAFGLVAISDKNGADCNASNACRPGTSGAIKSAALISDIGWIAGGVLLAGGAGLVLFAPRGSREAAARIRLAPMVASTGGGVVLGGSW
jgi:hypothetical protein